jgi:hypothetical protein
MAKSQADILKDFGRTGWIVTATRPDTVTVLTENPANPAEKIPVEQPTGNLVWGITSPNGQYDEVVVKPEVEIPYKPGEQPDPLFTPVKGPKEEIKPSAAESTEAASPQLAAQRGAEAAAAQALAEQRKAEEAQRTRNRDAFGYAITDAERATLERQKTDQNLTQQQVDLRARELEQSSAARGRELDIAGANSQIAAANQALASKRLELDQIVRDDASKLDWAKFEYLKAKDASDAQIAQARLDLERLTQQQTTQLGQQTLEQRKAEAAQTGEQKAAELTQRQAEQRSAADIAAQTAATTAASSILTNERAAQQQAAQTGGGLLQQRAAAAQGMLGQVLGLAGQGQRSGNMGGGLMSAPAGLGEQLVSGIQGWTADLLGGQGTLDAAANMVRAASGGDVSSPAAAAAIGTLTQMLDRYKQLSGTPHPIEQAHQAAQASAQRGGMVAPVGTAAPAALQYPVAPQPPAPNMAAANQVPGQNYGAATAYTGGVAPWNAQPGPAIPSFTAPVTITIGR